VLLGGDKLYFINVFLVVSLISRFRIRRSFIAENIIFVR
jgi:hypothetical protein